MEAMVSACHNVVDETALVSDLRNRIAEHSHAEPAALQACVDSGVSEDLLKGITWASNLESWANAADKSIISARGSTDPDCIALSTQIKDLAAASKDRLRQTVEILLHEVCLDMPSLLAEDNANKEELMKTLGTKVSCAVTCSRIIEKPFLPAVGFSLMFAAVDVILFFHTQIHSINGVDVPDGTVIVAIAKAVFHDKRMKEVFSKLQAGLPGQWVKQLLRP